jgi:chromosomal replication initiator protein
MRHVALSICSGVPDLEGALVPVHAYASLTDTPITLSMAQSVLKSLIDLVEPRTSIEEIQRAVCREFGLDLPQLKSKSVSRRFSYPRQIATYVAKELPPPRIAAANWQGVREKSPYHGAAFDQQDRRVARD